MKSKIELIELSIKETHQVAGGSDDDKGFWYSVGKFFAEQANASDSIYSQYGNTNNNL
jgi:hypothetical protein